MDGVLKINNLIKLYGSKWVINGIDFELYAGDVCGIFGGHMCGKTTLFNLVCGSVTPSDGEVEHYSADFGVITANYDLLPELTVLENIALAGKIKSITKCMETAKQLIVNLPIELPQYPRELDVFQLYVVKILRTSIIQPRVIVIDDFFVGVNSSDKKKLCDILLLAFNIENKGIIFFTGDESALKYASRKYCLRDGKLVEVVDL